MWHVIKNLMPTISLSIIYHFSIYLHIYLTMYLSSLMYFLSLSAPLPTSRALSLSSSFFLPFLPPLSSLLFSPLLASDVVAVLGCGIILRQAPPEWYKNGPCQFPSYLLLTSDTGSTKPLFLNSSCKALW